jgi:hypothetical protein
MSEGRAIYIVFVLFLKAVRFSTYTDKIFVSQNKNERKGKKTSLSNRFFSLSVSVVQATRRTLLARHWFYDMRDRHERSMKRSR